MNANEITSQQEPNSQRTWSSKMSETETVTEYVCFFERKVGILYGIY